MSTEPFASHADALPIPSDGIASRPLFDMKSGTKVVLFALDEGQEISPHLSPFPAHVLLLAGRMRVSIGSQLHELLPDEDVAFPMGHPHGLLALEPSHFLLIMKRAVKDPSRLRTHQAPAALGLEKAASCPCMK